MTKSTITIPGYEYERHIFRSARSVVFVVRDQHSDLLVAKSMAPEYPSAMDVAKFKYEYKLLERLQHKNIIKAVALEKVDHRYAIIQDFGGTSLNVYTRDRHVDLDVFFTIARQLVEAIAYIHSQRVIHKDINPSNILWDRDKNLIQLIDFGIATELGYEQKGASHGNRLEGSLPYLSPEQTGRMNRLLDYRTDYYSLGATLHELLTGQQLFDASEQLEWVHCHLARAPRETSAVNPNVPRVLSDVIAKLLAKNAEHRYQSSRGILADLEAAQKAHRGELSHEIAIGAGDVNESFQVSQTLYGRENEIETILDAFDRLGESSRAILLVGGYSGIGKTALINELQRPLTKQNGRFISGKFDQYNRSIPYLAIVQAFKDLAYQLLVEDEKTLRQWSSRIGEAIQPIGRLLIDLVDEFELIIGVQPEVQKLSPDQERNRLFSLIERFVVCIASDKNPLVMFLDDLQWADLPTFDLMNRLLSSSRVNGLLIIAAYRSNEVSDNHPFTIFVDRLSAPLRVYKIDIKPLEQASVERIVADTLDCDVDASIPIAQLIIEKTRGNPYFINELLQHLHHINILEFDYEHAHWKCNYAGLRHINISNNLVDFLISKVSQLSPRAQKVLQLAACIGNRFDFKTLAAIVEMDSAELATCLMENISNGFIYPLSSDYQFLSLIEIAEDVQDSTFIYKFRHDKIQQAAYHQVSVTEAPRIHLGIARLLVERSSEEDRESRIIEIAHHFIKGLELVTAGDELEQVCRICLGAAQRAMSSTAYHLAFLYLDTLVERFPSTLWQDDYEFAFDFYSCLGQAGFLAQRVEVAEAAVDTLISRARDAVDQGRARLTRISHYAVMGRIEDTVHGGLEALSHLGIKISPEAGQLAVLREVIKSNLLLWGKKIAKLIDNPSISDRKALLEIKLLNEIAAPAYMLNKPNLFAVCVAKNVNLAIKHGNCAESAFAYVAFSVLLGGGLRDYKRAHEFGKLAIAVNRKLDDLQFRARILHVYAGLVLNWNETMKNTRPFFEDAIATGEISGDLVYYGLANVQINHYDPRLTVSEAYAAQEKNIETLDEKKVVDCYWMATAVQMAWCNFLGKTSARLSLSSDRVSEDAFIAEYGENYSVFTIYLVHKSYIHIIYQEPETAYELAVKAQTTKDAVMSLEWEFRICICNFMAAVGMVEANKNVSSAWRNLKAQRKLMKIWAKRCPDNFEHHLDFMDAMVNKLKRRDRDAERAFESAIKKANTQDLLEFEALFTYFCGRYYLDRNRVKLARLYLTETRYLYQRWGAVAVVEYIDEKFRDVIGMGRLVANEKVPKSVDRGPRTTAQTSVLHLDLETITKTSTIMEFEEDEDKLLTRALNTLNEAAGAETVTILIQSGDHFLAAASRDSEITISEVVLSEYQDLPHSIVEFVLRTGANVILADASQSKEFSNDRYISRHNTKSVLTLPIHSKSKVVGVIHCENNVLLAAFSEERIALIRMLAVQVAISLQNFRMLSDVKKKTRLEADLAMARSVQETLLPLSFDIPSDSFDIAASYTSADQTGGDWYGLFYVEPNKTLLAFCGDVTGHGVSSALITGVAAGAIESSVRAINRLSTSSAGEMLEDIMKLANHAIFQTGRRQELVMTMVGLALDLDKMQYHVLNCAHCFPFIKRDQGVKPIGGHGAPLGEQHELHGTKVVGSLQPGDRFVLYTDGLIEGIGEERKVISHRKLAELVGRPADTSKTLLDNIQAYREELNAGAPLEDDHTCMVIACTHRVGVAAIASPPVASEHGTGT
ncbi:MAG: AAA family ATPase [Proteobacteria bacterium]|nr:AAA family ATPase [Pseudomonadota bacterium]